MSKSMSVQVKKCQLRKANFSLLVPVHKWSFYRISASCSKIMLGGKRNKVETPISYICLRVFFSQSSESVLT